MLEVEFDLSAWAAGAKTATLKQRATGLSRQWADDAKARLQEKYAGGPMSRYLTARTGRSRRSVRTRQTSTGAELSVSGPGVFLQEYGGTILPKTGTRLRSGRMIPYLTFRLYQAADTSRPTGRWVRARQVTIKAKHPARDSAREALADLFLDLGDDP